MQVDHQIFALCRLDVTGDGSDEIVACAWDGQTYILDQQRNSVRFQFEEPVRAFCTGNYNVTPGFPTPCLVYNSFNNKVKFIIYNEQIDEQVRLITNVYRFFFITTLRFQAWSLSL